jgi:hypothetical protein
MNVSAVSPDLQEGSSAPNVPPVPGPSRNHAPDSTPPITEPSMEPVIAVTQRLLGLRGSPPGTLASLAEHEIKMLCMRARPLLLEQPMLLELEAPIKVCGDVHGQFTDLLRLLEYGGFPPESNYLFLGDYVSVASLQNTMARKFLYTPRQSRKCRY